MPYNRAPQNGLGLTLQGDIMEPKIPVRIYAPTVQHMLTDGWMARYWLSRLAGVVEYLQVERDHEDDDGDDRDHSPAVLLSDGDRQFYGGT